MDQARFSTIAHGDLEFWNPVSSERMDDWIRSLSLSASSRILDVGCGRGEFLIRAVEHFRCRGTGVDRIPEVLEAARTRVVRRLPDADLTFRAESFNPADHEPASSDLVACIGSTHAVGDLTETLRTLAPLAIPGGGLLIGDGYWKQPPAPGYLDFLGAAKEDLRTHEGNQELARELGLEVVREHQATPEEWSHYEDTYAANVLKFVEDHPEDSDVPSMKRKIEAWREAYLQWGRSTLGFGLYLLKTPEAR